MTHNNNLSIPKSVIKKYMILILSLMVIGCKEKLKNSTKTKNIDTQFIQLIDSATTNMINKPLINSASIAIYYNGKEYINHYGELVKGKGNTPTNTTIYEIGSLSKVFTGTMVANAVLEKKINVEDEISMYLGKEYQNLRYSNTPIKIKHVLTHSSGFPNVLPLKLNAILNNFLNYDTPMKINEVLKNYSKSQFLKDIHAIKTDTIPGFKYAYSSAGTELTAHILEVIYKADFEDLLIEFFSEKIGMKNTSITLTQAQKTNLACGYHTDNPTITSPIEKLPWGASGSIKSTLPDLMKFIKYQLKDNEIVQESHKPLVQFNEEFALSYFWNIDSSNKKLGKQYYHHGGVPRSQCYIFIIPKHNFGAFIITNQSGKNTATVMMETLNVIFDGVIK